MTNVWMDILTGRFAAYITRALEESEHFDFMTLMRRVLTDKTLMNFKLIVEEAHDVAEDEEKSSEFFNTSRKLIPKISKVFDKLSVQVSVEDMRQSSYVLRTEPRYTYMEMYWIYIAWYAFGEDGEVPVGFIKDVVIDQGRQTLKENDGQYVNEPLFAMMMPKSKKGISKKNKSVPDNGIDVVQLMLQRMDHKLLAVKEKSVMGKLTTAEAAEATVLH